MLRSLTAFSSSFIIFLTIIFLLVIQIFFPAKPNIVRNSHLPPLERLIQDSLMLSNFNDSIPYYRYEKIEDSIRRFIQEENKNNFHHGSGLGIFSIGVSAFNEGKKNEENYLRSTAYYLKNGDPFTFYSRNSKNYIKSWILSEVGTPVKIMQEKNNEDWTISFPITKTTAKILNVFFWIFGGFIIAVGLIFFVHKPLKILLNIAQGEAFSDYNVKNLNTIAWITIAIGFFIGLIKIVVHLLFSSQVPEQFYFSYYIALMSEVSWIIGGLIILLIAKAFKNGQKLQEEQSLTV